MINFTDSILKCNSQIYTSKEQKILEEAYDTWYLNYTNKATSRIPKILHQIWLGSPFPDKYKVLTDLWKQKHPDWTFLLWTEKEIEEFGLTNKWMYDNMRNPSAKSDVVRYEIAYSYGGVYLDTDFYCCQNMDELLYLDFFCGMGGSYNKQTVPIENCLGPSIFGCSQGNKMIEKIIEKISRITQIPRNIPEIMNITGPGMFSQMVIEKLVNIPLSVIFPTSYFYPFPGAYRESIRNMSLPETENAISHYMYPETYAIHLWYCSWQKAELLNL